MHPIEVCFDALKDALEGYKPSGAGVDEKLRAKEAVRYQWQSAELIGSTLERETHVDAFISRAKKCIKADGWNN